MKKLCQCACLLAGFALGACAASNQQAKDDKSAENQKVICKWERPTGSHISQKVCYTVEQKKTTHEDTERAIRRDRIRGRVPPSQD